MRARSVCPPCSVLTSAPDPADAALTPLEQYKKLVDSGVLRADEHQTRIIQKLQRLHDDLATYEPPQIDTSSSSLSMVCRHYVHLPHEI